MAEQVGSASAAEIVEALNNFGLKSNAGADDDRERTAITVRQISERVLLSSRIP